jgi:predicted nucleotidyltransferase
MRSRAEIMNALALLAGEIRRNYKVRRIGLFGSYAR